jgi:hypothetical protein
MQSNRLLFFASLFGCWVWSVSPGIADGAIAIGVPNSVAKEGVAQGYSIRAKTPEDARRVAMGYCGDEKNHQRPQQGYARS